MTTTKKTTLDPIDTLLLRRRQLVPALVDDGHPRVDDLAIAALSEELAAFGYVASSTLSQQWASSSPPALSAWRAAVLPTIAEIVQAGRAWTPLYPGFPTSLPSAVSTSWLTRLLVHYAQTENASCLTCGALSTTHVLSPCRHVVCDRCFDVTKYAGCPICGVHLDAGSPFIAAPKTHVADEHVVYKRLLPMLASERDDLVRGLFESFCLRSQVMSPVDVADLVTIVTIVAARPQQALSWLPPTIPVKENVAHVFGTLMKLADPKAILADARRHLRTATDVLRVVAAYSGADPALQATPTMTKVDTASAPRWWGKPRASTDPTIVGASTHVVINKRRFKVAKLARPLRRFLLDVLEGFDADNLVEDMLRHRSLWVWLGQFLHAHEQPQRWPNVCAALLVVRGRDPKGVAAPKASTWAQRLEAAITAGDVDRMLSTLIERPGEFARRVDRALRLCERDDDQRRVLRAFVEALPRFATPVLCTLQALLPTRTQPSRHRLVFPKGAVVTGVALGDKRDTLPGSIVGVAVDAIERELLARFKKIDDVDTSIDTVVVDEALQSVIVPFNERTAARGAVALTRGSSLAVPASKTARLFLHWCEPEKADGNTDVDLSVALYDDDWNYVGVCSYYELNCTLKGATVATSSGDFTDAPWPDGASEFIDIDRDKAVAGGVRYAVMLATAYSGLPFSALARAFAGIMLRDDVDGAHFDPRTVQLRFDLQGDNGVYMPLAFDLEENRLHWLDVYTQGSLQMNSAASASYDIQKIVPRSIAYFGSGVRMSMATLLELHAAARAERVVVRHVDGAISEHRRNGLDDVSFLAILRSGRGRSSALPTSGTVLAALVEGDVELPAGAAAWVLLPKTTASTLAAADLLR